MKTSTQSLWHYNTCNTNCLNGAKSGDHVNNILQKPCLALLREITFLRGIIEYGFLIYFCSNSNPAIFRINLLNNIRIG